jgi:hypothetical protein
MISLKPMDQALGFLDFMHGFDIKPSEAYVVYMRVVDCHKWQQRVKSGKVVQDTESGYWYFAATRQPSAPPIPVLMRELDVNADRWGVNFTFTMSPMRIVARGAVGKAHDFHW